MGHHHNHGHDHEHYYDHTKLHDNQHIFIKHYLDMLETCKQGIQYISNKNNLAEQNDDKQMVQDCIKALDAIQDANILARGLIKHVDKEAYDLINSYEELAPERKQAIFLQEREDLEEIYRILTDEFFPKFFTWSEKVKESLMRHID